MITAGQRDSGGIVIVGASHAAVQLADQLRVKGYTGALRLIGAEPHQPYQRPPLSKALLKGDVTEDAIALRSGDWYRENHVDLVLGEVVVRIDRGADGAGFVHTARFDNKDRLATYRFDRIVLATGAQPRLLAIPGADHPDVQVLRDLDDARRLADSVAAGPLAVIGGGFVGLEAAATARALGAAVTVIEAGPRLMGRALGPHTAEFLHDAHVGMGIDILVGAQPAEIITTGDRITGVRLEDGRTVDAATVLVGIGVQPRDELARQLALDCAGGVLVDASCLASDGTTVAIGDCTVQRVPAAEQDRLVRLESIDNAVEQAAVAASTLLGLSPVPRPTPWFWSDQGNQKLQIVGLLDGYDDTIVRADPDKPARRSVLYLRDTRLIAAECVNAPADFVALRSALSRGDVWSPNELSDASVPLRKLLAGRH